MKLIVLLIDERPEEVTDIKESIEGEQVEVIYSTFDELPENHKRVSEMVIERCKTPCGKRRGCNDSVRQYYTSGKSLQPNRNAERTYPFRWPWTRRRCICQNVSLVLPRNMREGGSLTILATALVDTGSQVWMMLYLKNLREPVIWNLYLDRSLSEKRIFPAIDIQKSSTRREDLLLDSEEQEAVVKIRKALGGMKAEPALEQILNLFKRTKDNKEFIETVKKMHL